MGEWCDLSRTWADGMRAHRDIELQRNLSLDDVTSAALEQGACRAECKLPGIPQRHEWDRASPVLPNSVYGRRAVSRWLAADLNRLMSPKERATNMAPSSPLTIDRASSSGDPGNLKVPSSRPCCSTSASHFRFFRRSCDRTLHPGRKRLVICRQHAAQAHPLAPQNAAVQTDVGIELAKRI